MFLFVRSAFVYFVPTAVCLFVPFPFFFVPWRFFFVPTPIHLVILRSVGALFCIVVIMRLMRIILDTGSCKDLKIGKASTISTKRLVDFVELQEASWFYIPAAAKEVGNLNHRRLCDGPLPQDQLSCPLECRADSDGDVLGLRFAQALLPAFVPKDVDEVLRDLSTGNLVQEREDGQFTAHLLVRG